VHSHCAFSANILRIWTFVPFLLNLIAFRSAKTEKDFWGFLTVLAFLFGLSGCIYLSGGFSIHFLDALLPPRPGSFVDTPTIPLHDHGVE
jgi:hypothetical protein